MIQQINLYQPMFRKQKKVFSAVTMLQICLFFIVVFAGLYAYELYRVEPFRAQVKRLDNDLRQLTSQIENLKKQQPAKAKNELLQKEIARVSKELEQRKRIQQILGTRQFGNDKGFSAYLEALARQHVNGAWLTRVSIRNGGVSLGLEGKTLASEYVPVYLQKLSMEQALAGSSFNSMELQRPKEAEETGQIIFKLSTN
jgi:Tfp pilus assembly protein PilN